MAFRALNILKKRALLRNYHGLIQANRAVRAVWAAAESRKTAKTCSNAGSQKAPSEEGLFWRKGESPSKGVGGR